MSINWSFIFIASWNFFECGSGKNRRKGNAEYTISVPKLVTSFNPWSNFFIKGCNWPCLPKFLPISFDKKNIHITISYTVVLNQSIPFLNYTCSWKLGKKPTQNFCLIQFWDWLNQSILDILYKKELYLYPKGTYLSLCNLNI